MANRLLRREYIAIASAAALAGCSGTSDDPADDPSDENGTDPTPTNETNGTAENESEIDVDDPNEDSDSGNESDGGQQEEDEPTDEELAQKALNDAQSAFEDAVAELTEQALLHGNLSDVSSATNLSTGPIEDHLSATRQAITKAESYDTSLEQTITIRGLTDAEMLIRRIVENQPALHDIYADVDLLREDLVAENFETVTSDADRVQQSIDGAQPVLDNLQTALDEASTDNFDRVDALDAEAATGLVETFANDVAAMEAFVSAAQSFAVHPAYVGPHDYGPDEGVAEIQSRYEDIAATLEDVTSVALNDVLEKFRCTVNALAEAANDYRVAGDAEELGKMQESNRREDEAVSHLEDAQSCEMFEINIPE